jgi:SAM-dependent methyltransferase
MCTGPEVEVKTMNLVDIVQREPDPAPWVEGEKIPWHDPAFSQRMLKEHLSQEHDAASRRFPKIDQHVAWIHKHVLPATATRILDLGCGPGLYTSRLARLGHECTGIDFAPASVTYARKKADEEQLACTYHLADVREAEYGQGYHLVMFTNGEFNVFTPDDAALILRKAHSALVAGGILLLEPHTLAAVQKIGEAPTMWYSSASGLFSSAPHLCLTEAIWDPAAQVAIERYYIVDAETGHVTRHAGSMQAYSDQDYRQLLLSCGFRDVSFYPSLLGTVDEAERHYCVIVAHKAEGE